MKEPKTPPAGPNRGEKPVEIPAVKRESDRYLEGYVDGVYDAACVGSLIALAMCGIYWYGVTRP